jgi:hypothetical protein
MTEDEKKKYKQFLQNEMRKLDEQESTTTSSSGQSIE